MDSSFWMGNKMSEHAMEAHIILQEIQVATFCWEACVECSETPMGLFLIIIRKEVPW